MKTKTANYIALVIAITLVASAGWLGYRTYSADKFCRDNGHDSGNYKALEGGYYSCIDYTKYRLKDVKN